MVSENRNVDDLHPKVKELALKLVEQCKKEGLNIRIGETYRTVERQDYLYAQGRTRAGRIVTYAKGASKSSYHQWRLAFDIFNNVRGDEYNTKVLERAGEIGKKLGLEWGGDWMGFRDTPHYQYTFGLTINELRGGKQPPKYEADEEKSEYVLKRLDVEYIQAIGIFIKAGLVNTPKEWLITPNIKYLDSLLTKIGVYLYRSRSYANFIDTLVKKKVITIPGIWRKKTYNEDHAKAILVKLAPLVEKKQK